MNNRLLLVAGVVVNVLWNITPAWGQSVASPQIFESTTIRPNFQPDPQRLRGVSGGSVPASDHAVADRSESSTGPCLGYVDTQPDHTLTLTAFFEYLQVAVTSQADTTLIVRGPGGSWCNDDAGEGKNPAIAGQWQSGRYSIWVGSYEKDEYHPYVLQITQEN
jgi:hypothetical protein